MAVVVAAENKSASVSSTVACLEVAGGGSVSFVPGRGRRGVSDDPEAASRHGVVLERDSAPNRRNKSTTFLLPCRCRRCRYVGGVLFPLTFWSSGRSAPLPVGGSGGGSGVFAPRRSEDLSSSGVLWLVGAAAVTTWLYALIGKYSRAESNVMALGRMGATVLHSINANNMSGHTYLKMRQFDRIVFNFPHAGFKGKEDDMSMVNSHRKLLKGFFGNARHLLQPYGEIHISHKIGYPYDSWDIKGLASKSFLDMFEIVDFHKGDYPGYNQKKGDGPRCNEPFHLGVCCTFKFCLLYFY